MSNDELTKHLLEGLEVAAQAAAKPADSQREAAESFGDFLKSHLNQQES